MAGGVILSAHFTVEALPLGMGQVADRLFPEGAAKPAPGFPEATGIGIKGFCAGEEGRQKRFGEPAVGFVGAEVQAADAAIGREWRPDFLAGQRRTEGGPFLIEPCAGGEFAWDGVFAAAGGVEQPLVGVFDVQFGIGGGPGEEKLRLGIGSPGAAGQEQRKQPPEFHGGEGSGRSRPASNWFLRRKRFCVIITNMNKSINDAGAVRLSLSLPNGLAGELDQLVAAKGAASRSALVADLVREAVTEHRSRRGKQEIAGAITLVYDHHARNLQARLTELQHDAEGLIVSVMHVHLSHHDCLEVLVVRGPADRVRELADRLAAVRGVKHGKLTITTTEPKE